MPENRTKPIARASGGNATETTEAKTARMMNEMYARQPPTTPAPTPRPTFVDNLGTLGAGMARSTQRMIDQRKIIAEKK